MIRLDRAGYRYPSASEPTVQGVDLRVQPGEIVLLTGPTGCGKSTLLRLAAGLLQRHGQGEVRGEVRLGPVDPATLSPSQRVRRLGFVGQEPGDQVVTGAVADEVAFAMESAGLSPDEMEARIPVLLAAVGLDLPGDRDPRQLSGGQVQRLVTAAALSAGADHLVLDEPLAQLDPAGARTLLQHLRVIAAGGVAVLLVEHRLELCWPMVDRVVVMDQGTLATEARPAQVEPGDPLLGELRRLGLVVPGRLDLLDRLGGALPEGASAPTAAPAPAPGETLARLQGVRFRYPGAERLALDGVDLVLGRGERVALLGANGSGKSTLLGLLSGLHSAPGLHRPADVVGVPQDPDLALFQPTVRAELATGPRERRAPDQDGRVLEAARALSVEALLDRPPQALSRGQRLRVAVAAALACRPEVLLLDEPTSGQDHDQVERMMAALHRAQRDGALVFATHDVDLALRHATRILVLHEGRVVVDGPPAEALQALPEALPLPPLVALCRERGWATGTAAELARALRGEA